MKIKYQTPKVSDRLIRNVSRYNVSSFEDLYNITSSSVFGLAYSIVGNKADADDVVQDVFISIYEKANQYKGGGKAMAWIFTITKNHALMRIRDRKKRKHVNLDDIYDVGIENTIEEDVYKENTIRKILDTLNEDERQIVIMHAMSNIKHKDIALIMNMNISTVISKYRRSIKKIKKELEVNEYEKNRN